MNSISYPYSHQKRTEVDPPVTGVSPTSKSDSHHGVPQPSVNEMILKVMTTSYEYKFEVTFTNGNTLMNYLRNRVGVCLGNSPLCTP